MGVQINGDTGNISATKADYSGNVTIGGTLTYEDVTNIDSVGLVTARSGIEVGARPGVAASISVDGNMIVSGITTIGGVVNASSDIKVGSGVTVGKDGDIFATGVTTSTTFVGALTGNVTGTASGNAALTGSTNNTVTTVTGANAIQGEANLTFDGDDLLLKSSTDGRRISFAGDGTSHYMKYDNTLGGIILNGYGGIAFETNGTNERLRIDSSGKVNIGNTGSSWVGPLSIGSGASGQGQVLQLYSNSDTYGGVWFGDADSGAGRYVGAIYYYHDNNYMRFDTGGSERLRINSSGQLLSGVTGNAGAADANAVFGGGGDAGTGNHGKIYITQSSSNPSANSAIGFIGFSNQDLNNVPFAFMGVYADADHGSNDYPSRFAFWTTPDGSSSASEKLRIASGGDVTVQTGNLVIGTSGKGINFSADANASGASGEILDDYEEGNWTPTSGSPEYWTSPVGTYVKIGRMVHAAFQVVQNGGGSNTMRIDLPFSCANDEASRNGVFFGYNTWDAGTYHQLTGNINKGAADFYFYRMDGSGNGATYDQLGSGKVIKGVVCYQTA